MTTLEGMPEDPSASLDRRTQPIQIDSVLVSEPYNPDSWVATSLGARIEETQQTIMIEALLFADLLPPEEKNIFLTPLYRHIAENYESLLLFLKSALPHIQPNRAKAFVNYLQNEIRTGTLTVDDASTLINHAIRSNSPPELIVPASLTAEAVQDISQQAKLRQRFLDDQEESLASGTSFGNVPPTLDEVEQAYRNQFNEELPTQGELGAKLLQLPKEIGERFDAHGLAKGHELAQLIELLENGVDKAKTFHTLPLIYNPTIAATGAAGPYHEGGIIILGPVNAANTPERQSIRNLKDQTTQIKYVLLNRQYYFAIPQLEAAFPAVRFIKAYDMETVLTNEVLKIDHKTLENTL